LFGRSIHEEKEKEQVTKRTNKLTTNTRSNIVRFPSENRDQVS